MRLPSLDCIDQELMHFLAFPFFSRSTSVESRIAHEAWDRRIGTGVNQRHRHSEGTVCRDCPERSFANFLLVMSIDVSTSFDEVPHRFNVTAHCRAMKRCMTEVVECVDWEPLIEECPHRFYVACTGGTMQAFRLKFFLVPVVIHWDRLGNQCTCEVARLAPFRSGRGQSGSVVSK